MGNQQKDIQSVASAVKKQRLSITTWYCPEDVQYATRAYQKDGITLCVPIVGNDTERQWLNTMQKKRRKTNPSKKPLSEATLKRERHNAQNEAIMALGAIAFMAVGDVFNPTDEKMEEFRDKFFMHAELMAQGKVKYKDYADTLYADYGIVLNFE